MHQTESAVSRLFIRAVRNFARISRIRFNTTRRVEVIHNALVELFKSASKEGTASILRFVNDLYAFRERHGSYAACTRNDSMRCNSKGIRRTSSFVRGHFGLLVAGSASCKEACANSKFKPCTSSTVLHNSPQFFTLLSGPPQSSSSLTAILDHLLQSSAFHQKLSMPSVLSQVASSPSLSSSVAAFRSAFLHFIHPPSRGASVIQTQQHDHDPSVTLCHHRFRPQYCGRKRSLCARPPALLRWGLRVRAWATLQRNAVPLPFAEGSIGLMGSGVRARPYPGHFAGVPGLLRALPPVFEMHLQHPGVLWALPV